jgi:PNKP adenylyltransferase domain, C-terminal region
MTDEFAAAARQWQDDGWALVDGLVPEADVDAVADDVALLYGTDTFADYNRAKGSGEFVAPDGKAFREQQFDGNFAKFVAGKTPDELALFGIPRAELIVGRYDPTDRFAYWPRRIATGGTVLAPGAPEDALQSIDVRDLADWILRASGAGSAGVFNAAGRQMRFASFLEECGAVTGRSPELVWVSTRQLLEAGADPWMGVPLWIGAAGWEAANRVDATKAVAAGLTFRPLFDTILDAYECDRYRVDRIEGLDRVSEQKLLASARQHTSPSQLDRLRQRAVGHKRALAIREFSLGIEAFERFIDAEPLYRIHECVFGVLALESEPVDPRL